MSRPRAQKHIFNGRDIRGEIHNGWEILGEAAPVRYTLKSGPYEGQVQRGRRWRVRCTGCSTRKTAHAGSLLFRGGSRQGREGRGCKSCSLRSSPKIAARREKRASQLAATPCRCCGRTGVLAIGRADKGLCTACQRRGYRNGKCEACGLPLYRTKPCTHEVHNANTKTEGLPT